MSLIKSLNFLIILRLSLTSSGDKNNQKTDRPFGSARWDFIPTGGNLFDGRSVNWSQQRKEET